MKSREELNALKNEVKALNAKLKELTDEELKQVFGGFVPPYPPSAAIRNPKVAAGPDQNGWEDPKYILGGDSDVFTFND